jgi:hypothetical protein
MRVGRFAVLAAGLAVLAVLVPGGDPVRFVEAATSSGPRAIFEPVPPARILNTRQAGQGPAVGPGAVNERLLQVTGAGGVAGDATAVVLTVTAINPTARSYLTIYPNGQSRPDVSMLNFNAGEVVTNLVTVGIGSLGRVRIYNDAGSVNVIVDVTGYYRGHDHDDRYDVRTPTLIQVNGDGTNANNGAALLAAMAGIVDASASKPYVVRLGPGVFDVGVNGMDVKPFVTLEGSGQGRSIVTAPGSPDLSPSNGGVYGTLRTPGESTVRDLTVRNTGGTSTIAVGIEIGDGTSRLHDLTIEVSGGSDDNFGIVANHFANAPRLDLDRGTIEIVGGGGIGQLTSSDRYDVISVRNTRVDVTGGGFGIAGDASRTSASRVRVVDTEVFVSGGGTGLGGTANGELLYSGVQVNVTGGTTTLGIGGSGSGFHPVFQNSTITVSGGSTNNKGFDGALFFVVTLQNTRITASGISATAMELGLGTTDSGNAFIDGSVLTATTIFNSINADTQIKVGGSKLAGSTIVNGPGLFVCASSYKSDYTALSATCT